MNQFLVGTKIRISASFYDNITKDAVDPGTVEFSLKAPDGTITTAAYPGDVIKESTGKYHYDIINTQSGFYYYKYEGTDPVIVPAQGQFESNSSQFPE